MKSASAVRFFPFPLNAATEIPWRTAVNGFEFPVEIAGITTAAFSCDFRDGIIRFPQNGCGIFHADPQEISGRIEPGLFPEMTVKVTLGHVNHLRKLPDTDAPAKMRVHVVQRRIHYGKVFAFLRGLLPPAGESKKNLTENQAYAALASDPVLVQLPLQGCAQLQEAAEIRCRKMKNRGKRAAAGVAFRKKLLKQRENLEPGIFLPQAPGIVQEIDTFQLRDISVCVPDPFMQQKDISGRERTAPAADQMVRIPVRNHSDFRKIMAVKQFFAMEPRQNVLDRDTQIIIAAISSQQKPGICHECRSFRFHSGLYMIFSRLQAERKNENVRFIHYFCLTPHLPIFFFHAIIKVKIRYRCNKSIAADGRYFLMNRRIHFAAFSLIELLITIMIIVILASLLLPSLQKAKDKANSISCLSNTKSIMTASISYSDSSDGWIVPIDFRWNEGYDQSRHWTGLLMRYGVKWSARRNETSTFRCPSQPLMQNNEGYWNNASSIYLLNVYLCGSPRTSYFYMHKQSDLRRPSEAVHGAESVYTMEHGNNVKNFKFRHSGGDFRTDLSYSSLPPPVKSIANVFFMDGHAAGKTFYAIINGSSKQDFCLQDQGFAESYNKCGISLKELE